MSGASRHVRGTRAVARLELLDLFCCGGGASAGYNRAGFNVTGVDLEPQPNYPFAFVRADAVEVLNHLVRHEGIAPWGQRYDVVSASPPCQGYSKMSSCRPGLAGEYPQLIDVVRSLLAGFGGPWVIENVDGSGLATQDDLFGTHGVLLCGTMFGRQLYRHRLFETSFPLQAPHHPRHVLPASKAGRWRPGTIISVAGHCAPISVAREAMGIDWMPREQLKEAIPPDYAAFIGARLLEHMAAAGVAT